MRGVCARGDQRRDPPQARHALLQHPRRVRHGQLVARHRPHLVQVAGGGVAHRTGDGADGGAADDPLHRLHEPPRRQLLRRERRRQRRAHGAGVPRSAGEGEGHWSAARLGRRPRAGGDQPGARGCSLHAVGACSHAPPSRPSALAPTRPRALSQFYTVDDFVDPNDYNDLPLPRRKEEAHIRDDGTIPDRVKWQYHYLQARHAARPCAPVRGCSWPECLAAVCARIRRRSSSPPHRSQPSSPTAHCHPPTAHCHPTPTSEHATLRARADVPWVWHALHRARERQRRPRPHLPRRDRLRGRQRPAAHVRAAEDAHPVGLQDRDVAQHRRRGAGFRVAAQGDALRVPATGAVSAAQANGGGAPAARAAAASVRDAPCAPPLRVCAMRLVRRAPRPARVRCVACAHARSSSRPRRGRSNSGCPRSS